MKVLNLLELRKEAQALGIENYAKYTKEELAKVIAAKKRWKAGENCSCECV